MDKIKRQINNLDDILLGSITKRYGTCGKKNCRCHIDLKNRHGPYYIWTRKENGKTITKSLTKDQFKMCKKAISNMKRLQRYIEMWKIESIKKLENSE